MNGLGRRLSWLMLALCLVAVPSSLSAQERAMVPVAIDGEQVRLATITYKPSGNGPFPTLIFHHGSTGDGRDPAVFARSYDPKALAGWFTARGWAGDAGRSTSSIPISSDAAPTTISRHSGSTATRIPTIRCATAA
jgi:hypothetical protein